jgi:hypothetical protein
MHFAGSVVVPESVENPLKYYHNNTAKSRALIRSAVKGGVRHFIFSSTAATYGVPEVSPVTEDSPKLPINPYGMSKLMTEIMLADTARAHPLNSARCAISTWRAPIRRRAPASPTAGATHLIKVAVEAALGKRGHVACSAPISPRPTAPACATISTFRIWPPRTCWRWGADRTAGTVADDELRLWARLLGARSAGRGGPRHQPHHRPLEGRRAGDPDR